MVKKLDILLITRGILALSVILWHVEGYKENYWALFNLPGRTAVIIFFGMSGFVISHGFIFEKYSFIKTDLKIFYIRRLLRIMPLFLLISLATLIYQYFFYGEWLLSLKQILPEIFMTQFNHSYQLNSVFWTLGIEMQFYLIAPLIIYFTIHFINNLRGQLFFYIFLYVIYIIQAYIYGPDIRNVLGNFIHFYSGILSCWYIKKNGIPKIPNLYIGFVISIIFFLSNYLYHHSIFGYFTIGYFMINLSVPAIIVLHYNLIKTQLIDKLNLISYFLTFGTISYGIYAWHPFIIRLTSEHYNSNLILVLTSSIAAAYISYNLFEKPILSYVKKKK